MRKFYSLLAAVALAATSNAQIVISQVYGGGGNSGATYKNDFIELFNRGQESVTLTGAYVQYASATGAFNLKHSLPTVTIPAGGYYLIKEQGGTTGADLPTADYTPASSGADGWFNMSGTAGKVALTSSDAAPTAANSSNVIDFVGFGTTANMSEGDTPTPAPSSANSVQRKNGGCTDSNNNGSDFTAAVASARNSATAISKCATLGVSDLSSKKDLVKNTIVFNDLYFGTSAKVSIYNTAGQVVKIAEVTENSKLDISALSKGTYVVTGLVNGQTVSQKIIKK